MRLIGVLLSALFLAQASVAEERIEGIERTIQSQIDAFLVDDFDTAFTFASRLQDEGVFANPIITPAVPPGQAMIRTSYMATHQRSHLDRALEALEKVGRELRVI